MHCSKRLTDLVDALLYRLDDWPGNLEAFVFRLEGEQSIVAGSPLWRCYTTPKTVQVDLLCKNPFDMQLQGVGALR